MRGPLTGAPKNPDEQTTNNNSNPTTTTTTNNNNDNTNNMYTENKGLISEPLLDAFQRHLAGGRGHLPGLSVLFVLTFSF